MKPDLPIGRPTGDEAFARQLAALSAQLREDGIEPERDLWPQVEARLGAPAAARGRRSGLARPWAAAALAACVVLAVGLGVGELRRGLVGAPARSGGEVAGDAAPAPVPAAGAATGSAAAPAAGSTRDGLHAVEKAFDELRAALERSPDDPELSRLVLMVHHTRGRLLRLQADDGSRGALRGRG